MAGSLLLSLTLMQAAVSGCLAIAEPVMAGAVVDASNTAPAPCGHADRERKLRYDPRSKVVRAQVALAAGEALGRVFLPRRPTVLAGDRIAVAVRLGSVTIAREGVALQRADAGAPFFVRTADGAVFAAPPIFEDIR